jgi:hypothetical protein
LFARHPHLARFRPRLLSVALCQGGALHYIDGKNGIQDLDVWSLYAAAPGSSYPYRRRGVVPFGKSGFVGVWSGKVDCLGRSLDYPLGIDPVELWRDYLGRPSTLTARLLALKAVVLLEPEARRGEIVWPPKARR